MTHAREEFSHAHGFN